MRRSLATVNPTVLDFSDFSGGLNFLTTPENIAQTELSECVNFTYSSAPGLLRTRPGMGEALDEFETRVTGMYWFSGQLLAATHDRKLWSVALTDTDTSTEIGTLTGGWRPMWCEFGGKLYIASHGTLQEYDGTTLTTISGAPSADVVYARSGRLFCSHHDSDTIHGSAVGDPTEWTVPASPTDADPVEVQIGYKVAGSITAIVPALTDVIVFKERGIFRLIGDYPNWSVKEVTRDEAVTNHLGAVSVAGYVYYLDDYKGLRLLQGTQCYEEIAPGDALPKVNPWIRANLDHDYSALWHLPARNMLVVVPNESTGTDIMPCYYEFGLQSMPALLWRFPGPVQAIVEPDRDHLYIAVDNAVYDFSGVSAYDPSGEDGALELVSSSFATRKFVAFEQYLVKRMLLRVAAPESRVMTQVPLVMYVNDVPYQQVVMFGDDSEIVYENEEIVYESETELFLNDLSITDFEKHNLLRQRALQLRCVNNGAPMELTRLMIEVVPVGVNS